MNCNCEVQRIGRRDLLKLGAASAVALGLEGVSQQVRAAEGAPTAVRWTLRRSAARDALERTLAWFDEYLK